MPCAGNSEGHCCWVNGKVCSFLEENTVSGRRWACALRRGLGDWDAVLSSPEYQENVAPVFDPIGINCKDWPDLPESAHCGECGYGN
jgi:hypothetical protein